MNPLLQLGISAPLSDMDRQIQQAQNQDIIELNTTISQIWLTSVDDCIQQKQKTHFFSSSHGTFTRIDHILDHKIHINKLLLHIDRLKTTLKGFCVFSFFFKKQYPFNTRGSIFELTQWFSIVVFNHPYYKCPESPRLECPGQGARSPGIQCFPG